MQNAENFIISMKKRATDRKFSLSVLLCRRARSSQQIFLPRSHQSTALANRPGMS